MGSPGNRTVWRGKRGIVFMSCRWRGFYHAAKKEAWRKPLPGRLAQWH
jgi:hypothetical protein